jgi:hypothetical protein
MPVKAETARAGVAGTAQVRVQQNRSGIQWVLSQFSCDSVPQRAAASVTVKLNGQYVTSSPFLPQTASGQPFITLNASDVLTADFAGLTNGDVAIFNLFYAETHWGNADNVGNVV